MKNDDFIDNMCEYDLYYETFKDDLNDPFCHEPSQSAGNHIIGELVVGLLAGLIGVAIAFFS